MMPVFAVLTSTELLIVAGVIVLLFGAPQLPKLARAMGEAKREFESTIRQPPAPGPPPAGPSAGPPPAGPSASQPPAESGPQPPDRPGTPPPQAPPTQS